MVTIVKTKANYNTALRNIFHQMSSSNMGAELGSMRVTELYQLFSCRYSGISFSEVVWELLHRLAIHPTGISFSLDFLL
ncbi:hypothetical protein FHW36_11031 [Chitinophaga polysaccharea]|uniref:Uncharacterized protein n=1 Tax=Chitinophaga polysaccharea TaxID=1293035 RepID=A0A561P9M2_9BACT|nr:hypothetical protein FHW36_11031 [Chitinophaga polysaccharea]